MQDRIKYICYYDKIDSSISRNYVLAATNKIDYIISALNRCNVGVDIVSVSCCIENKWIYVPGQLQIDGANSLRLFSSFGLFRNPVFRVLSRWLVWLQFIFWFLYSVKSGEQILIYHSLGYCKLLTYLKKIKKCKFIGEIEEIYQDVTPKTESICKSEYAFINSCDKFIFPTSLLNKKLNAKNKPYLVIHGVYRIEKERHVSFNDDDVHIVYAGTFDPHKGGCMTAINLANYLPSKYHIHILGFGNEKDTASVVDAIHNVQKGNNAKITYHGLLKGDNFIDFLQKCQIGLSTQNPSALFNDSSFPSKILTYMANGLDVVTIRIPVIELSDINDYVYYYESPDAREIADAIISISNNAKIDMCSVLRLLDSNFVKDLKSFYYK